MLPFSWVAYRLHLFVARPSTTTAQANCLQSHSGKYMRFPLIHSFLKQMTNFLNDKARLASCVCWSLLPAAVSQIPNKRKKKTEKLSVCPATLKTCVHLILCLCVCGGDSAALRAYFSSVASVAFSLHPSMTWTSAIDSKPDSPKVRYPANKIKQIANNSNFEKIKQIIPTWGVKIVPVKSIEINYHG